MQTIDSQDDSHVDFNDMVKGAASMDTENLEKYHHQIGHLLAMRKATTLSARETELLLQINIGIPALLKKRYDALSKKMNNHPLSNTEQDELEQIVDQIEMMDAKRLENLIELAHLRNVSLDDLMHQLGLKKPDYA